MNYVFSKKVSAAGDDRRAGGQALRKLSASNFPTIIQDLRATSAVYSTVNAASS